MVRRLLRRALPHPVYKSSGKQVMAHNIKISIRKLFKIFGPDPKMALEHLRALVPQGGSADPSAARRTG